MQHALLRTIPTFCGCCARSVPGLHPIYRESMEASRRAYARRMRSLTSIEGPALARTRRGMHGPRVQGAGGGSEHAVGPSPRLWKEGEASFR